MQILKKQQKQKKEKMQLINSGTCIFLIFV